MTFWWNRAYIKIISNCSYFSICWWNVMPRSKYLILIPSNLPAPYKCSTNLTSIYIKTWFLNQKLGCHPTKFHWQVSFRCLPKYCVYCILMYLDDGIVDLCTCPRARVPAPSRRKVNCPRPQPRRTGFSKLTYAAFLHFISLSLSVLH